MEEDEADEVSEIKAAHFEESMKFARRCQCCRHPEVPGYCTDLAADITLWHYGDLSCLLDLIRDSRNEFDGEGSEEFNGMVARQ